MTAGALPPFDPATSGRQPGAPKRACVVRGGAWDAALVADELGVPPLDIEPVKAPVLLVDGQIEPDATAWLAEVHARHPGTATAESYGDKLAQYAEHLLSRNTSLRGATKEDVRAYVKARTVTRETRVSGNAWQRDRTVLKLFTEWLHENRGIDLPITIEHIKTQRGLVSSMVEGRNIARASAAGTPLTPQLIPLLLAAARRGPNGAFSDRLVANRDEAFMSLGLACGARAGTLTHLTIYELPPASTNGDLVEMRLPGAIAKSRREVRLPAFARHLARVHDYIRGGRRAQLKGWRPDDPIQIAEVHTGSRFRGIVDTLGTKYEFNTLTAEERRRLVTPEGEPAMIFLSETTGRPLSLESAQEITGDVSKRAELADSTFPHVHTHDLRHTYATHLAALFYMGVATGAGRDMHGKPERVDVRSAVTMACLGLGHVDEATTALYIQQVGMMTRLYGIDDFLARR